ncbi:phage associated protein [Neisseria gonorrhoeae]|uniref:Phage associated protein n=1 Tax=Neisseria gonorrhoeae TaxID=485 RepID=A0A379B1N7_NEIGO|nr:phage associated protein [Neisseria gonorrhoeae]
MNAESLCCPVRINRDFLYLSPETGDIGHTKLITNADYFYDFEEAVNAGLEEIGNQCELSYSDFERLIFGCSAVV